MQYFSSSPRYPSLFRRLFSPQISNLSNCTAQHSLRDVYDAAVHNIVASANVIMRAGADYGNLISIAFLAPL